MGIWEFKLGEGNDADLLARIRDAGSGDDVHPRRPVRLPGAVPRPDDPARVEALCAAIHRFAPFEPEVILCLTGHPAREPTWPRRVASSSTACAGRRRRPASTG